MLGDAQASFFVNINFKTGNYTYSFYILKN